MIEGGFKWENLNEMYTPTNATYIRKMKDDYLISEIRRMGFRHFDKEFIKQKYIPSDRYFWFTNLVYYLGNFRGSIFKIENFYLKIVKPRLEKRRIVGKKIINAYRRKQIKRLLPKLISHGKIWVNHNCLNLHDIVTHELYVNVPPERWVICQDSHTNNCWWIDVSSAVQLLGSPGSHAGENPYNRAKYPPEFILEVDDKLQRLNNKYEDLGQLSELNDFKSSEDLYPCYEYKRYLVRVKAIQLFESFKEHGFIFPSNIFINFTLGELRSLALKIFKSWQVYPEDERLKYFPDGNIFPVEFINNISKYGNLTNLKLQILETAMIFAVHPKSEVDRASGCIHLMMILASVSRKAHDIIERYGLCECSNNYDFDIQLNNFEIPEMIPFIVPENGENVIRQNFIQYASRYNDQNGEIVPYEEYDQYNQYDFLDDVNN
jgi:hypothetical protein